MVSKDVIDEVMESLLFISGDGLKITDIAEQMNTDESVIKESIQRLKQKYSGKCGIHLITYNGKVQFSSNPAYHELISCVLNPIKEKDLSNAALETIAIIAYRQPVTRVEVEQIRGNNSDYTIQLLLNHNLIQVVGRKDSVGKPLLFGTTEEFLKRFQISSVDELPDYNQLLESIRVLEDEKLDKTTKGESMYREYEISEAEEEPTDEPKKTKKKSSKKAEEKSENVPVQTESVQTDKVEDDKPQTDDNMKEAATTEIDQSMEISDDEIPDFLKDEPVVRVE